MDAGKSIQMLNVQRRHRPPCTREEWDLRSCAGKGAKCPILIGEREIGCLARTGGKRRLLTRIIDSAGVARPPRRRFRSITYTEVSTCEGRTSSTTILHEDLLCHPSCFGESEYHACDARDPNGMHKSHAAIVFSDIQRALFVGVSLGRHEPSTLALSVLPRAEVTTRKVSA